MTRSGWGRCCAPWSCASLAASHPRALLALPLAGKVLRKPLRLFTLPSKHLPARGREILARKLVDARVAICDRPLTRSLPTRSVTARMNKASCLGLLSNAVLVWNTARIVAQLRSRRPRGYDDDLARV